MDVYHLVSVELNVAFLSPAVFEVFQLPSQASSVQQPGVQGAAMHRNVYVSQKTNQPTK